MPRKHNFGFSLEKLDLSSVIICVCMVALLVLTILILVRVDRSKQHYCPRIPRDSSTLQPYGGTCAPNSQCWADPDKGFNFQVSGTASDATLSWLPEAPGQPVYPPPSPSLNLGQLIDDNGNPVNYINSDTVLNKYHKFFSTYTLSSFNGSPVTNGDTVFIHTGNLAGGGTSSFTLTFPDKSLHQFVLGGGNSNISNGPLEMDGKQSAGTYSQIQDNSSPDNYNYTLSWGNNTLTLTQSLCK